MIDNYTDLITSTYIKEDPFVNCRTITFQVTDDCCLNCSYCYQINKGHRMMSTDTVKQGMDLLFQMYDENKEDGFINHHTKGLIIEFIGGEPFMNIDAISYGSKYFLDKCIEKQHIWLTNFKINISTNGLLYFDKKVQEYLKVFRPFISLNVTIDGPKELHDSCRKDYDGNGSFDRAVAAFDDWCKYFSSPGTKVTIAPENLNQISKIVKFFIERNCFVIYGNPIYEHEWTIDESKIYYDQLKQIANEFLHYDYIHTNIFNQLHGRPLLTTENDNWCGGNGMMLSFDPDGVAYPCIRYMKSSLGNSQKELIIGNTNGLFQTKEEQQINNELKQITRRSQSTDECFNCPIASGCAWCSAWNYQKFGTCNKRDIGICWMHRARSLVNSYYYNLYYREHGSDKRIPVYLERSIANQIISDEEYNKLLELSFNN